MRILASALLYFAVVFAVGFALGPIRVFWLERWLGPILAVLCEIPFLLAAMIVAARRIPDWIGMSRRFGAFAAMGIGALAFQQIADFSIGIVLRGIRPAEQLAYLSTPPGLIYLAALIAFAAMPALVNRPWSETAK